MEYSLDDEVVEGITPALDAVSRVHGKAEPLVANAGIAFIGVKLIGVGFSIETELANRLIRDDPRNRAVLFPYLNGKDLNSRPDCSAGRWVINFDDLSEDDARRYPEVFEIVERQVRPQRERLPAHKKRLRENWWKYEYTARSIYDKITNFSRVVVMAQVSKTVMPVFVQPQQVFDQKLIVFTSEDAALLSLLSSAVHYWWAISRSATMKADLSYSPTDVFQTLPRPEPTRQMRDLGDHLDCLRGRLMRARASGLTATYSLVHSPACRDEDIVELRKVHQRIDYATTSAYGWDDLDLDHGFQETRQGTRYTIGPMVRQEILDRLLELNHKRHDEEVAAGPHGKKNGRRRAVKSDDGTLF